MKYVPTTTQASDVPGLRNWTVNELNRLSSSLGNEEAASSTDLAEEIAAREAADAALSQQIQDLYVSTDGSNRTFAQTSAPASPNIGDLWFDTDNNNTVARWSGSAWQAVDDARIAANASAIAAETAARQAADTTLTSSVNSLASRATALESTVNSVTDGNLALKARIASEETARASGDTALASRATALEATVNNATTGVTATAARLTTEETARATADSALASRATALEATVNSGTDGNLALKARIASEETARASGDTAIASSVSSLTATVNTNNTNTLAAIAAEETARASADFALSSRASSLEATVNSATDGNLALKARIASEETARASGDGALASSISSLTATVNNNNSTLQAAITSEATARANADNALSTRATSLEATVNSGTTGNLALQARIATEESARASGDNANAVQINTVSATASSKNRTFAQAVTPTATAPGDLWLNSSAGNAMFRWTGSAWEAVDDTRIAANAAAITTESTARASADAALATQINTVTTTVNGNTASISTLTSSVNGLQARYGVSLNVNGYVTGFVQNNNGSSGDFTILADKFSVVAPGGGSPVTPFSVTASGVQINGNLIVSGSISSPQIAAGAITQFDQNSGWNCIIARLGTGTVDSPGVTIASPVGSVKVDVSCFFQVGVFASNTNAEVQLIRVSGGTTTYIGMPFTRFAGEEGYLTFFAMDTPPPGVPATYHLRLTKAAGGDPAIVNNGQLLAVEYKK